MSNASGIKVKGYKSAIRSLKNVGVPTKEINQAGRNAGEIVAAEARTLVPVRSGKLLKTIKVSSSMKGVSVRAGNDATVPYANPIHWGWWKRNIRPRPFFVTALGYTRDEVFRNYYASMDKLILDNSTRGTDE